MKVYDTYTTETGCDSGCDSGTVQLCPVRSNYAGVKTVTVKVEGKDRLTVVADGSNGNAKTVAGMKLKIWG